ncbi:MAG: helix-turn-helix transcriptional regulator [Minisyncoccia bacterium]
MDDKKIYEICNRIKALRMEQHIPQNELADRAGIPYTTLVRIEMCAEKPSIFMVAKLAEVLGTSLKEIMK